MGFKIFRSGILIADQTAIHPAASTIAQAIFTPMTIPENDADYLYAAFECSIEQTGSSQAQTLTVNITDGAAILKAFTFKTYAALKFDHMTFWAIFQKRTSSSIQLQLVGGSTPDANTAITGKNAFVAAVDGARR
jgi:hypothetical protein